MARHWLRGSNLPTWVCRTKSHLILPSFYTQEPQLPSILHRISKAGRTEYSGRVLRADSGGGGRCGKEQTDYFFPLLANEERPPLPLLNNNPQVRMRSSVAGGYLRRGHRGCGSAPNIGHRDQQTSANPRSRPPTRSRNHGRSGSSFRRTANHRLVHLPRAAAGEYMPGLWVGEGTQSAPLETLNPRRDCRLPNPSYPNCRDSCLPKCRGGTICPCPFPCPHPRTDPVPSAPAPGREQRLRGAAVARSGRSRPTR